MTVPAVRTAPLPFDPITYQHLPIDILSTLTYIYYMDILILVALLVAAAVFLLIELFLIPGVSVAGILSGACAVYANYYAFAHLGVMGGFITLGVTIVAGILAVWGFMRSKTLDRLSLKQEVSSTVDRGAAPRVQVGDRGVTLTRLALIGQALIDGEPVEVKSAEGFMDERTPVVVTRVSEGVIWVAMDNCSAS